MLRDLQCDLLDQRRIICIGLRAIDPLRYRSTLQVIIRGRFQILGAGLAA
jgi:hypothetical protein